MACDNMERKMARADYAVAGRRYFASERELVQHLLSMEREREASTRRVRMRLIKTTP